MAGKRVGNMKCRLIKTFEAYDAGPDGMVKLKPIMLGFQDVVSEHSKKTGCGLERLLGRKKAWVLHRICFLIYQRPKMGEDLIFFTWHKGVNGFRAYRDYEIWSGTEKRVSATSLWLFINLEKKKILKAPEESREWYSIETDNALTVDIDAFKPVTRIECPATETISIRYSDIDPIGHVNNAVYVDCLETAVNRLLGSRQRIENVMIQFNREITQEIRNVQVGIRENKGKFVFEIVSESGIHAVGDFACSKMSPNGSGDIS